MGITSTVRDRLTAQWHFVELPVDMDDEERGGRDEGGHDERVQHAEGSGTFPVPRGPRRHAVVHTAPHALGRRV